MSSSYLSAAAARRAAARRAAEESNARNAATVSARGRPGRVIHSGPKHSRHIPKREEEEEEKNHSARVRTLLRAAPVNKQYEPSNRNSSNNEGPYDKVAPEPMNSSNNEGPYSRVHPASEEGGGRRTRRKRRAKTSKRTRKYRK